MSELKIGQVIVEESEIEFMVSLIEQQREEIRQLYFGSIKLLTIIGLAENGRIKAGVFEEGGNAIPEIIKGAGSVISLVMQSQVPVIGKKAEAKLQEQFGFFGELVPVFVKYGEEFGDQVTGLPEAEKPKLLNE